MEDIQNNQKTQLPNSTTILVLGICSIVTCLCLGVFGLGLGITALVMSKKTRLLYETYPDSFTENSYNNAKAGKVCAIIGVCLSSLAFIYFTFYFLILGMAFSTAGMMNGF